MTITAKKKITLLSALCAALLAAYILTFLFAPERSAARNALWTALDPSLTDDVRRIELTDNGETTVLENIEGNWFVNSDEGVYPALRQKAQDLLDALSGRGSYAVRSTSEASSERLLLTEDAARRLVLKDADGNALLDLLVGDMDATGKDIYLRLAGGREVRSGPDVFTSLFAGRSSWLDKRLFPDHDERGLGVRSVQRVVMVPPDKELLGDTSADAGTIHIELPDEGFTLVRSGAGWQFEDDGTEADTKEVETYLRTVLDCEANNFTSALSAADPVFTDASSGTITVETGDGARHVITSGPRLDGMYGAAVSGSPYVYLLMNWQIGQLFEKRRVFSPAGAN